MPLNLLRKHSSVPLSTSILSEKDRNLAHGSSEATEEVKAITEKMNQSVENTVNKLNATKELISSSLDSMNQAKEASFTGQQNAQTSKLKLDQVLVESQAQHEDLVLATEESNSMAVKIEDNAEKIEQVNVLAHDLNSAALRMTQLVQKFKNFDGMGDNCNADHNVLF